jgi:NAD(P)H dehydrogenase (quinone)
MKHAVILGHPSPQSFAHSVVAAYCNALNVLGHQAIVHDLYALGFSPCLRADEIPRPTGFSPADDVQAERAAITGADVFVFVYPLWFNAPPAIVTGYVQRVFGMGFGYGPIHQGGNEPLLRGKRMLSFTSSGSSSEWLKSEGAWSALTNLFDRHVADVCGFTVLDHIHVGGLSSQTPPAFIDAQLANVTAVANRLFKL